MKLANVFILLLCIARAESSELDSAEADLAWVEQPQSWHQQAIRIVDHPFTTLAEVSDYYKVASRVI